MDPTKPIDPFAQFAEMQALLASYVPGFKGFGMPPLPMRYEGVNPVVQEIAILAAMHNMASMLQKPEAIKAAINEALAERAKKLGE
ncbi:MAG: hypothetical protein ACREM6_02170, partial [Vulcanimicrobiaceae bacterium]